MTSDANVTAMRLGRATLGYLTGITLVITLSPFEFSRATSHGLTSIWSWPDLVMNLVMFVPLGFMFQLARARAGSARWWDALLFGALFSCVIEVAQLFAPSRFTSWFDVLANSLGAGLGALAFVLIARRLTVGANTISNLALELPLMGLVYLLVPLLWLVGLAGPGSDRGWLMLLVAAFGGAILGAVHGGYLEPGGRVSRLGLLLVSGVWFAVSALPGAVSEPGFLAAGVVVTLGIAWLQSVSTARQRLSGNRRFELPTLRLALPLFAAFLALSSLWPLTHATGTWHGALMLFPAGSAVTDSHVFAALEHVAAFTLVGYIIAEFHGRADAPYTAVVGRVVRWSVLLAVMLELARGWHADIGSSALMGTFAVSASLFGGYLYHLQRDHVRALWAAERAGRPN